MATGTVKWFKGDKGYGFIAPDEGSTDIFVHISALSDAGLSTLGEGQRVEYEVRVDRKTNKSSATAIKLLN